MPKNSKKSKKSLIGDIIFYAVFAVIIVFLFVFFISPRFMGNKKSYGKYENAISSKEWMTLIGDDVLLNEISIPGTHDSATQFVQYAYFSKCQTRSIKDQLDMGYRYLDIRLAIDADAGKLKFMHGFAGCKVGNRRSDAKLYLDSVIQDCYKFLDDNPGETIIFVAKKDHGDQTIAEFQEKLASYIDEQPEKWFTENRIPQIGEVRGKLVLARRYDDEASLGAEKSGLNLVWTEQGNHEIAEISYELNEQKNGLEICIQDRYKYDADDKWAAFTSAIDNVLLSGEKSDSSDVYITFLSTNGDTKFGHPIKYAIPLNKKFWAYEMQSGKNYGWIILDYATTELAQKVYMTNF